jgi:5'-nucleotidase (lipoprotein e(P4) family)
MNKTVIIFLSIITFAGINSCSNSNALNPRSAPELKTNPNDHLTMAVLYQQSSAEYRALCYQAFNLAQIKLEQNLRIMGLMRQQAIVVDIDETILDNSPYEAKCVLDEISYPAYWEEWILSANAKPVPGALEFLKTANSAGIKIFYISNRKEKYREATLKNLADLGFPVADNEHLLMQTDESSKKLRREKVAETHAIMMLIGDNLNDFSEVFDKKLIPERFELTDSLKNEFGNRFIVLPNAIYGDWESALYNYDYSRPASERADVRRSKLVGF